MTGSRRARVCTGVVVASLTAAVWGADTFVDRTLTLDDSIRLAVNNSQTLLSSREDVTIALQRVHQAESLLFPQLDLNANWSKFRTEGNRPFLTQWPLGSTLIPDSPRANYYSTRIDIYQPVYQGGRLRNTWRQARIAYEKSRNVNDGLTAQVAGAAKQAFYDYLFAQLRHKRYAELLRHASAWQPPATASLGMRWRFMRQADELRKTVARAALEENTARLAYLRTLNLELNTNVQLSGDLATSATEIDLQKMLAWASRYRSELRQTEYQQESDALGISLSLAERTPSIGLGATYERSGNDLDLPVANWAGTLNIHLPVSFSDMFFGWAKVRERRAQYRQATVRHAEVVDQVERQVRDAYLDYRYWQDELSPRANIMSQAQSLLSPNALKQLAAMDRLEAELFLVDLDVANLEAVHGHLWSMAALEKAVGHSLAE